MAKSKAKSGMSKPLKKKAVAKKKKPVKKPARKKKTIRDRSVKYIWRLFRFSERFELPDDVRFCRKGPLLYTKSYVGSGQEDESISHQRQINALRSSPNKCQLRYMYEELKEIAANQSRCYRGYILNAKAHSATDPEIALELDLPAALTRKLLKELAVIGLIERVPMPVFDPDDNEPPSDKNAGGSRCGRSKKKKKKKAARRPGSSHPERARNALRAKSKVEKTKSGSTKVKSNSEIEKEGKFKKEVSKKKNKTAAAPQKGDPKTKDLKSPAGEGNEKIKGPRLVTEGIGPAEGVSASGKATADTHSTVSTGSDAGGAKQSSISANPPASCPAATIARRLDKLYDPTAKSFAMLIYEKMKVPHSPTSLKGKQELGNFATAWTNALRAGLPPSVLARLWDSAEADAVSMAKKRQRLKFKKSPEAVWRSLFNKRLNAAIARIPDDKPGNAAVS